ncbi:MAG: alpha/beta hydrolase [Clostridiales bacterium]|nr:alpha/beta hydrolase [Clostridiales bacterium]
MKEDFADYNKHIVILFDAVESAGYHSEVYEELNAVLDTVSYNYLSVKGFLPKYNLVGHSRGGVVNLMYATEHPYSVENLISNRHALRRLGLRRPFRYKTFARTTAWSTPTFSI